eukprot:Hpha_TRINITY_DN11304_c0_g3::TRINITY_DN11304_c0_g3_i1::g.63338::m.63338
MDGEDDWAGFDDIVDEVSGLEDEIVRDAKRKGREGDEEGPRKKSRELPKGWEEHWDSKYKRVYWFNVNTGASRWDPPPNDPPPKEAPECPLNGPLDELQRRQDEEIQRQEELFDKQKSDLAATHEKLRKELLERQRLERVRLKRTGSLPEPSAPPPRQSGAVPILAPPPTAESLGLAGILAPPLTPPPAQCNALINPAGAWQQQLALQTALAGQMQSLPPPPSPKTGRVKAFDSNAGLGILTPDDGGADVAAYRSGFNNGLLIVGESVTFSEPEPGPDGVPMARHVWGKGVIQAGVSSGVGAADVPIPGMRRGSVTSWFTG